MSVIGEMKDEQIWALKKRIKELEVENEKLKKENKSMTAALYHIREWTYTAFCGSGESCKVKEEDFNE